MRPEVNLRLASIRSRTLRVLDSRARAQCAAMAAEARRSAPWKDQTGQARRSIAPVYERRDARFRMGVGAGAPHSAALELARGGQNAVLGPTVWRMHAGVLRKIGRLPQDL